MSNETNNQPPARFWSRLGKATSWAINSAIKVIILILLLAILTGAVWLGLQEMDRSLNNLHRRLSNEEQKTSQLRVDVDRLASAHGEQARQGLALDTGISNLERRLAAAEQQLTGDIAAQNSQLANLEAQLTAVISATTQNSDELTTLSQGLGALQADLNSNVGELDAFGGQLDELQAALASLAANLADLREEMVSPESEVARLQQLVALYRVSDLIARSRLRLMENNLGLALADVELALAAVDDLVATSPPAVAEALALVQARLNLAAANLPANPLEAVRDLETTWERLDTMIAVLLVPANGLDDVTLTPVEPETAVGPAAATDEDEPEESQPVEEEEGD